MLQNFGRVGWQLFSRSLHGPAAELAVFSGPVLEAVVNTGDQNHVYDQSSAVCHRHRPYSSWCGHISDLDDLKGEASTSSSAATKSASGCFGEPTSLRALANCNHGIAGLRPCPSQIPAAFPVASRGIHSSAFREAADGREPDAEMVSALEPGQGSAEAPFQSLEDFDETLERWEGLLEQGNYDAVMDLLQQTYGRTPGMPPLAELMQQPSEEEQEKAGRRAREEALKEGFAMRRTRMVDELGRAYATGKRKCSVARVWIRAPPPERKGLGRIVVNGESLDEYFKVLMRRMDVLAPFEVTGQLGQFDVRATVTGGGTTGQAQAVRHGISKALQLWDPEFRPPLKAHGFLTRDARVVERKKPGKAKARKSFQWVKR